MKKLVILLAGTFFFLSLSVSPVFARGGYSHHRGGHYRGHNNGHYGGHYRGHGYWSPWDAAAIGLGAAIIGGAIINNSRPQREVVVRPQVNYPPPPPPPYREYREYEPDTRYAPGPVWIPGRYLYEGGGHYIYIPGHYEN